ncbi:unnamed protein product [Penicillium egyptiacum]|uniref:FAD dependent oxidoreductase domain-containing protein n=1 Tax=Penicillium egyptiacum TaxID=1303716 RepID=A0A9W4K388_9EURO|nr:unnamed protein product [Penicillium egyptiacum]
MANPFGSTPLSRARQRNAYTLDNAYMARHIDVAGIIGLSIAVKLSKYLKVTVIARELPGDVGIDYASPWAGAHFRPTPAKTEEERREQAWMRQAYKEFEEIAKYHPEAGVDFIPAVEYFDNADATSFLAEEKGYTTWPDFHILDTAQLPPQLQSIQLGVTYRSWVLNSPVYLKWLQKRAEAQGTRFIRAHLTDLEQVVSAYQENTSQDESDDILAVVDASGRGSMIPSLSPHGVSSSSSQTTVIKRSVIIGVMVPLRSEDVDDASTEAILKRVRDLCPDMVGGNADELASTNGFDLKQVYVARRPMRRDGLHFVLKSLVGHTVNPLLLISCYGAGANGYTISWGLACEVDKFFSPTR